MERGFYLDLAKTGLRMPIGTDLVLHEQADAAAIVLDGRRLGEVIARAARRYQTPLAAPLMNLSLEKADLLCSLGIAEGEAEAFHFDREIEAGDMARAGAAANHPFLPRQQAHFDAIRWVGEEPGLVSVGMSIGPFSLMTKLMADPITPLAMAARGVTAEEDAQVRMAERCLELAEMAIRRSLGAQIRAGARAVIVCEPAANRVYISPRQMAVAPEVFERFVMQPNLRVKARLEEGGTDLIFHNCGELTGAMVGQFATRLHPVVLSLGSSRRLWEDAASVPADVVLFGNLPTKLFYSDTAMPMERVRQMTEELAGHMAQTGHPFILGSECDVLHVPEAAETIRRKVDAMMSCGRAQPITA